MSLTAKQEAFALAYVETGSGAEAYRRAYDVSENSRDSWIYVEASQLLDNPKVALRVEELQAEAARLSLYTVKAAFDELEEARQLAHSEGQAGAAVSAINSKIDLFSLRPPKRVNVSGPRGGPIQTQDVSTSEAALIETCQRLGVDPAALGLAGTEENRD